MFATSSSRAPLADPGAGADRATPPSVGLAYLAVAAGFMLADAYWSFERSVPRPPDQVLLVPRADQYAAFNAPERFSYYEGARLLDRKYPVDEWPEIFLYKESLFDAAIFEYPFLDPMARRRLTYWTGSLDQARPSWPGPLLVVSPPVASVISARFSDQIVMDRLSDSVWLGLPRDRLRVVWRVNVPSGTDPSTLLLEAFVEPARTSTGVSVPGIRRHPAQADHRDP